MTGLEPVRINSADFKSAASAIPPHRHFLSIIRFVRRIVKFYRVDSPDKVNPPSDIIKKKSAGKIPLRFVFSGVSQMPSVPVVRGKGSTSRMF